MIIYNKSKIGVFLGVLLLKKKPKLGITKTARNAKQTKNLYL